ncbi:AraC family transcriptional regulator, partial [Streptococcus sp. S784/96/1]|uniref:AraC family transcriptional regulator n=1 Tax=Streptococcus sp. S784/96/1 TaxID=2653499 RepID=UPI001386D3BE
MDFSQLEQTLFDITPSERRYLKNERPNYIDNHHIITRGIEHIFHFRYSTLPTSSQEGTVDFFIRKQSRFTPVPNHITDYIELNYVYCGQSQQYINGKEILLTEGDLILIDTNAAHAVDSADYNDIIISININPDYFRKHFLNRQQNHSALTQFLFQAISDSQNHNQYLLFRKQHSSHLRLLFQQLLCEVYDPQVLNRMVLNHYFQLILLELIRSFSVEANGTSDDSHKQQLTLDILSYLSTHYANTSLESCAEYFGYNSSYFSSLVKSYTGQTFKTLLQNSRLEASIPFLLNSKQPIRDIALEVGFSNLNQFYKLFKDKYHQTPADFRRQNKHS